MSYKGTAHDLVSQLWGGKVWAHPYNDVMEMVSTGFHMFTVITCNCVAQLRGAMHCKNGGVFYTLY